MILTHYYFLHIVPYFDKCTYTVFIAISYCLIPFSLVTLIVKVKVAGRGMLKVFLTPKRGLCAYMM